MPRNGRAAPTAWRSRRAKREAALCRVRAENSMVPGKVWTVCLSYRQRRFIYRKEAVWPSASRSRAPNGKPPARSPMNVNVSRKGFDMKVSRPPIVAAMLLGIASTASAQEFGFQIDNGLTLEEVVASRQSKAVLETGSGGNSGSAASGARTLIAQRGENNSASTAITNSQNAGAFILQAGTENYAVAAVQDSPGSVIAQLQIGSNNTSTAAIVGGSNNGIAVAQIGNSLHNSIALVNSEGTRVVYGQAGEGYSGGVVIKNAPEGTVVRLN